MGDILIFEEDPCVVRVDFGSRWNGIGVASYRVACDFVSRRKCFGSLVFWKAKEGGLNR